MQVYQATVYTSDKTGLQMAVLGVNWGDVDNMDLTLDLMANGIATHLYDNCVMTDLWTGAVTANLNGGVQTFKDVVPHGNVSVMIKCLPF